MKALLFFAVFLSFQNLLKAKDKTCQWVKEKPVASLSTKDFLEVSGLAWSQKFKKLYLVNDGQGPAPIPFVFSSYDLSSKKIQHIKIKKYHITDMEALSLGPCPSSLKTSCKPSEAAPCNCLYFADIGDNKGVRASLRLTVLEEQKVWKDPASFQFTFQYPEKYQGADAESLAVDKKGDLWVLTKPAAAGGAHLFSIPSKFIRPNFFAKAVYKQSFNFHGEFRKIKKGSFFTFLQTPTDMAFSPNGKFLTVLTYQGALEIPFSSTSKAPLNMNKVKYVPATYDLGIGPEALTYVSDKHIFYAMDLGFFKKRGPSLPIEQVFCK